MNYRSEVTAVKRLTKTIEQAEAEAEAAKWDRAERLWAMAEEGYTQQAIADDTGMGQQLVSRCIKIWRVYSLRSNRPRYAEADYEVAGRGPAQRPESPEEIVKRIAKGDEWSDAVMVGIAENPKALRRVDNALAALTDVEHEDEPYDETDEDEIQRVEEEIALIDAPANSLINARRHVRNVIDYMQAGKLTPLDKKELPALAHQIKVGVQTILDAIEGGRPIAGDWNKALAELDR